jgi:hypothetical protein
MSRRQVAPARNDGSFVRPGCQAIALRKSLGAKQTTALAFRRSRFGHFAMLLGGYARRQNAC